MEANYFSYLKNRIVSLSITTLTAIFVIMQLYLLTNVGTKGEELSNIRNEQKAIRVENEMLKAQVLELRSNQVVLSGLETRAQVEAKRISVIDPEEFNVAAQN